MKYYSIDSEIDFGKYKGRIVKDVFYGILPAAKEDNKAVFKGLLGELIDFFFNENSVLNIPVSFLNIFELDRSEKEWFILAKNYKIDFDFTLTDKYLIINHDNLKYQQRISAFVIKFLNQVAFPGSIAFQGYYQSICRNGSKVSERNYSNFGKNLIGSLPDPNYIEWMICESDRVVFDDDAINELESNHIVYHNGFKFTSIKPDIVEYSLKTTERKFKFKETTRLKNKEKENLYDSYWDDDGSTGPPPSNLDAFDDDEQYRDFLAGQ